MLEINSLTKKEMLNAIIQRKEEYDGVFYFGVKSTKIYCIPSCKARKPKVQNIIFFKDKNEAIQAGFRGCKRCRSETFPQRLPKWFYRIIKYMNREKNRKIPATELEKMAGTDISTIRRYFQTNVLMSPGKYHRRIRLRFAHKLIDEGMPLRQVYKHIGFNSSSGFRSAFLKEFGYSPTQIGKHD